MDMHRCLHLDSVHLLLEHLGSPRLEYPALFGLMQAAMRVDKLVTVLQRFLHKSAPIVEVCSADARSKEGLCQ